MSALETVILRARDAFIEQTGSRMILVTPLEGVKLPAPPVFTLGSWFGIEHREVLAEHYGPVRLSYTDFNALWRKLTSTTRPDRETLEEWGRGLANKLPTLPIPVGKDVRDVRELLVLLLVAADYAGLGKLAMNSASARLSILSDDYEVHRQHVVSPWGTLRYPRKFGVNLVGFLGRSGGSWKVTTPRLNALYRDAEMLWPKEHFSLSLVLSVALFGNRTSVVTRCFDWDAVEAEDPRLTAVADALRAVQTSGFVPVKLMTRACLSHMTPKEFRTAFIDCGPTYSPELRELHRDILTGIRQKLIADSVDGANDSRATRSLLRAQGITQ